MNIKFGGLAAVAPTLYQCYVSAFGLYGQSAWAGPIYAYGAAAGVGDVDDRTVASAGQAARGIE